MSTSLRTRAAAAVATLALGATLAVLPVLPASAAPAAPAAPATAAAPTGTGDYVADPFTAKPGNPFGEYRVQPVDCGQNTNCAGAPVSGPGAPMVDFP